MIINNLLDSLNDIDKKICVLKFIQKRPTEEIAGEMNLTERTIYRKSNSIIEKLSIFMLNKNWNTNFIRHQINSESWIENIVLQHKKKQSTINHHLQ